MDAAKADPSRTPTAKQFVLFACGIRPPTDVDWHSRTRRGFTDHALRQGEPEHNIIFGPPTKLNTKTLGGAEAPDQLVQVHTQHRHHRARGNWFVLDSEIIGRALHIVETIPQA